MAALVLQFIQDNESNKGGLSEKNQFETSRSIAQLILGLIGCHFHHLISEFQICGASPQRLGSWNELQAGRMGEAGEIRTEPSPCEEFIDESSEINASSS